MSSVTCVGAFVRKRPSAALWHSSLVLQQDTDTLLLIPPHKELSGVVSSGPRGGHVNVARDVGQPRPNQRPEKGSSKRRPQE